MLMKKRIIVPLLALVLIFTASIGALAVKAEDIHRTIQVTLTGGTGRASITSPAFIEVSGDEVYATIEWSSPYYEYMIVGGEKYLPVNTDGNSTFEIPIVLDEKMPVSAQTVAMSVPHEIDYTLFFDSSTIKFVNTAIDFGQIGYMLFGVVVLASILLLIGLVSKRKKREK